MLLSIRKQQGENMNLADQSASDIVQEKQ